MGSREEDPGPLGGNFIGSGDHHPNPFVVVGVGGGQSDDVEVWFGDEGVEGREREERGVGEIDAEGGDVHVPAGLVVGSMLVWERGMEGKCNNVRT